MVMGSDDTVRMRKQDEDKDVAGDDEDEEDEEEDYIAWTRAVMCKISPPKSSKSPNSACKCMQQPLQFSPNGEQQGA